MGQQSFVGRKTRQQRIKHGLLIDLQKNLVDG
jgi:hypothetical protein